MNRIKTTGIIGAGALGLMYAEQIAEAVGDKCFFIGDTSRANKISNTDFNINGSSQTFRAVSYSDISAANSLKPDLLIIAVKNHHLDEIKTYLPSIVHDGTVIISVLNGIDSEEFLERTAPQSKVLRCVAVGMDAVKEGGRLSFTNRGRLLLGSGDGNPDDTDLKLLTEFFDGCGMAYEVPEDINRSLWWKWMINIGVNQVSAVTGANYGIFHTDKTVQKLMDSAMQETVDVAKAAGIDLRDQDVPDWYKILMTLGPDNKTSMLQDIEAERKTEVESFSGRLCSLGDQLGVDVPVNRTLFRIIKTKELLYQRK